MTHYALTVRPVVVTPLADLGSNSLRPSPNRSQQPMEEVHEA